MLQKIKDLNKKIRWWVITLSVVGIIVLPSIIMIIIYFYPLATFNLRTVRPIDDFEYKDTITCTVIYSSYKMGENSKIGIPWLDYSTFTLKGLDTDNPQMFVDDLKIIDYQKNYEGEKHIVLSTDPEYWNTSIISIMKNTGSFVQTLTGIQAGSWKFHYAVAQKGRCE